MKKKSKGLITFIIIFSLILGSYYLFIINIDKFIKDKSNILTSHNNSYVFNYSDDNVINNILNEPDIRLINNDEVKKIMDSPFLVNLISKLYPMSKEKTLEYLKAYGITDIDFVLANYYPFDSVYLNCKSGTLAFSLDHQNIIYSILLPTEETNSYIDTNNEALKDAGTIESASEKLKKKLADLGILAEFNFEISNIRKALNSEYNPQYSSVYYIEDTKHNIKITCEYTKDLIYYLKIGYNK